MKRIFGISFMNNDVEFTSKQKIVTRSRKMSKEEDKLTHSFQVMNNDFMLS
jgi:hypothetical protein